MTKFITKYCTLPGDWRRLRPSVLILLTILVSGCAQVSSSPLAEYVHATDSSYKWSVSDSKLGDIRTAVLDMTSQTWHGITWKHKLELFAPESVRYPRVAMLILTAGSPGGRESIVARLVAERTSCVTAVLYGIPNQPIFERSEDALIAHTFSKTIETGDQTWPLLLPMTKSAVRAMDTIQEYAKKQWKVDVKGFVVSGASKRGWTTWLTAAADPERVRGIVPLVYDNLNLVQQMARQRKIYDGYSSRISDYTTLGLPDLLQTAQGKELAAIVDPWEFRRTLTMPKIIVNGTNDPYWTVDSLNLYWEGLPARKMIIYYANGGHDLGMKGTQALPRAERLIKAYTALLRNLSGGPLPVVTWEFKNSDLGAQVLVKSPGANKKKALVWTAHSSTRDFRKAKWTSADVTGSESGFEATVKHPDAGYAAVYLDFPVEFGGETVMLSTQIGLYDSKGPVETD